MATDRASQAEVSLRVKQIAKLLIDGHPRYRIVQIASEQWGVSDRRVDAYIAKARQIIQEECRSDLVEWRALHIARCEDLYQRAIKNKKDGLALQALINQGRILGLYEIRHSVELTNRIDPELEAKLRNDPEALGLLTALEATLAGTP